jgi:phosphatidylethanolamine-binding protein (PEBP) family uncharacterized protein
MDRRWVRPIGRALRGLRAGMAGLASHRFSGVAESIRLTSPVFGHGTDIPEKFTADGAGVSPPLAWEGVPVGTRSLVLLVEDPDVPVPVPVVHALVYGMPTTLTELGEGAIPSGSDGTGRHGFGHGPHHYAFQMFALDCSPSFEWPPGRIALLRQMDRHVLGFGVLFGVYERV